MAKVIRKDGESVDQMIKRFSSLYLTEGILKEVRKREYYKSKGQKRREKKLASERKIWVEKMKAARKKRY